MSKEKLHKFEPRFVRITLNEAVEISEILHKSEQQLINILLVIDKHRLYIRYGFKSLLGFCNIGLKLTRTQAQRIVTEVRQNQIRKPSVITHHADGKHRDFEGTKNLNRQFSFENL